MPRKSSSPPVENPSSVRFEATLPASRARTLAVVSALGLDRLPDSNGEIRLLLTADDARKLLEQGFEVHLKSAHPVKPLEQSFILTDKAAKKWLDGQLKSLPRKRGR